MNSRATPTILMVGHDETLRYLLGRFAERSGYEWTVSREEPSFDEIAATNPAVIIFMSPEILETTQPLLRQLSNLETPILVCSSITEEVRARDLGADHCLRHPLTYDEFYTVLTNSLRRP